MYFIKDGTTLYRFNQWTDIEEFTGKTRSDFGKSLPAAITTVFPGCEFAAFYGAFFKGWITDKGEPKSEFKKGNLWDGKDERNYSISDFVSDGGKL